MIQVYEGTPEQIVKQLSKLSSTNNYKVTVVPVETGATAKPTKMITFGMFPQLMALTDEDFKGAEWCGEEIDL